MSFPRYPEYKDSGVEWLGEVPGHWHVTQGRRLFTQEREPAFPTDDQLSATQKYGVVPQKLFMEMEDQKVTLALSGLDNFKHVEADDFVISLRSFQGGIERSKYPGCVSPAYTVLRSVETIDANYYGYMLKSKGYIEALQTMTDGIRDGKNISYQQFGQIRLPDIPLPEQAQIADFLDRETAKIDALVSEQRRLMALLKEKRQAVISHAVTRGLNPNAPLTPSGIEWLGAVPEHWEVGPLKRFWSVTDCKHVTAEFVDDGIPLASIREVQSRWVTLEGAKCTTEHFYELLIEGGRQPLPGDLIFFQKCHRWGGCSGSRRPSTVCHGARRCFAPETIPKRFFRLHATCDSLSDHRLAVSEHDDRLHFQADQRRRNSVISHAVSTASRAGGNRYFFGS